MTKIIFINILLLFNFIILFFLNVLDLITIYFTKVLVIKRTNIINNLLGGVFPSKITKGILT